MIFIHKIYLWYFQSRLFLTSPPSTFDFLARQLMLFPPRKDSTLFAPLLDTVFASKLIIIF